VPAATTPSDNLTTPENLRKHIIANKFDYLKDGVNKKGEVSFKEDRTMLFGGK
jgi:hypothetical protein